MASLTPPDRSSDLFHLDTHVVAWLAAAHTDRLSPVAAEAINQAATLAVSPMVSLELTYLHEIGRLTANGPALLSSLREDIGLRIDRTPFARVVMAAQDQQWTRDPFDRLIASQALTAGAYLLTADQVIRDNLPVAMW